VTAPARAATARRRIVAASGVLVTVVAGLLVHFVLPDTAATDAAGDALYAAAVYLLVVVIAPRRHPAVVGAVAATWCVGVELFQLTGLPEIWGAAFWPVTLVLGTVFDARDLWIYVAAVSALAVVDVVARLVRR
jgi:hypothetical protein